MKFNIGDIVIGNKLANERYAITNEGWIGRVIDQYANHVIKIQGLTRDGVVRENEVYTVSDQYFDLFKQEFDIKYDESKFMSLAGL